MRPSRVERDLGSSWRLVPCLHSGEASYPSHSRACLRCPCLRHLRSAPVENAPPRRVSWGPRRCRSSASLELAGLPRSYPMGRGRAGKCWLLSAPAHPARSARLWAGLGAPRRRSDPPRGSPGGGGDGEAPGALSRTCWRRWEAPQAESAACGPCVHGRACRTRRMPEPGAPGRRGRASDRSAGWRSGERSPSAGGAPRPRGLRGAAALLGGRGTGGFGGKVGASGSGSHLRGAGAGPGEGAPGTSVSQCECLNGKAAVRPSAFDGPTAGLLHCTLPAPAPPPPAVPTGILFGGFLAAREHLLPGSTPQVMALRGTCPSCAPCSREPWPPRGAGFSDCPCLSS